MFYSGTSSFSAVSCEYVSYRQSTGSENCRFLAGFCVEIFRMSWLLSRRYYSVNFLGFPKNKKLFPLIPVKITKPKATTNFRFLWLSKIGQRSVDNCEAYFCNNYLFEFQSLSHKLRGKSTESSARLCWPHPAYIFFILRRFRKDGIQRPKQRTCTFEGGR